jgi:hypothetical protein
MSKTPPFPVSTTQPSVNLLAHDFKSIAEVKVSGRTIYTVNLPVSARRTDFEHMIGGVTILDGKKFIVDGVESRCVDQQHAGWPIGLSGYFQ